MTAVATHSRFVPVTVRSHIRYSALASCIMYGVKCIMANSKQQLRWSRMWPWNATKICHYLRDHHFREPGASIDRTNYI